MFHIVKQSRPVIPALALALVSAGALATMAAADQSPNPLRCEIRATPEGGMVKVSAEASEDEVLFTVKDTGIGVSPKQLPHVFDRFWQATPKARLGSGLGLTIAKGVVEALGGRIWVESRPNEGTAFYFTLPLAPPMEVPQEQ